jgi:hypothetical protein
MEHQMVQDLIMVLTKNEDLRQDLWVAYLSGEIDSTFSDKLKSLSLSYDIQDSSSELTYFILNLGIEQEELDQLSDLQRSILFLTLLGYSLEQVGEYNGVKQVIINKAMVDLNKHPLWVRYGVKEELKPRRKIRANRRRN